MDRERRAPSAGAEGGNGGRASPGPGSPCSQLPCIGKLREELTCSICLEICIRPCTTPCGHNFCRRCLRGALQYSMKCPKCRDALPAGSGKHVNTVLWNTIQLLFPHLENVPPSPTVCEGTSVRSLRDSGAPADRTAQQAEDALLSFFRTVRPSAGGDVRQPQATSSQPAQGLDEFLSRLELSDPQEQWEVVSPHSFSGRQVNSTFGEAGFSDDWSSPHTRSSLSPPRAPLRRTLASMALPVRGDAMQMLRNTVTRLESSFPRQPFSWNRPPTPENAYENAEPAGAAEHLPFGDLAPESFRVTPVELTWAPRGSRPSTHNLDQEEVSQPQGSAPVGGQRRRERASTERRTVAGMVHMALSDPDAELLTRQAASPQRMPASLHHAGDEDAVPQPPHLQRIEIAEPAPSIGHSLEQFLEMGWETGTHTSSGAGLVGQSDDEYPFGPEGLPVQAYQYAPQQQQLQLGSAFAPSSSAPLESAMSGGAVEEEWVELRGSEEDDVYHEYAQSTSPSESAGGLPELSSMAGHSVGQALLPPEVQQQVSLEHTSQLCGPSFGLTRLAPESGVHTNNGPRRPGYGVALVPLIPTVNTNDAEQDLHSHRSPAELDGSEGIAEDRNSSSSNTTSSDSDGDGYDDENGVYEQFVVGSFFQGRRFAVDHPPSPLAEFGILHGASVEAIEEEWQMFGDGEGIESEHYADVEVSPGSTGYYNSGEFPTDFCGNDNSTADVAGMDGNLVDAVELPEEELPRSTPLPSNLCRIAVSLPQVDSPTSAMVPFVPNSPGAGVDPMSIVPQMSTEMHVIMSDLDSLASDVWDAGLGIGHSTIRKNGHQLRAQMSPITYVGDCGSPSDTNGRGRMARGQGSRVARRASRSGHNSMSCVSTKEIGGPCGEGRECAPGRLMGTNVGLQNFLVDSTNELEHDGYAGHRDDGADCMVHWQRCSTYSYGQESGGPAQFIHCFSEGGHQGGIETFTDSSSSGADSSINLAMRGTQEEPGTRGERPCMRSSHFEAGHGEPEGSCGRTGYEEDASEREVVHPSASGIGPVAMCADGEVDCPSTNGRHSPALVSGMRMMRLPGRINQFMSRLKKYSKQPPTEQ